MCINTTWIEYISFNNSRYSLQVKNCKQGTLDFKADHMCYGLNVCISPKFICWSPTSHQCDGTQRWAFCKVIRVRWGHEGRALMMGLVFLQEETPESLLSLSLHQVRTKEESGHLQVRKRAVTSTSHAGTLILDFPALRTMRNKFLLFRPPVYDILFWQPELRQCATISCNPIENYFSNKSMPLIN